VGNPTPSGKSKGGPVKYTVVVRCSIEVIDQEGFLAVVREAKRQAPEDLLTAMQEGGRTWDIEAIPEEE